MMPPAKILQIPRPFAKSRAVPRRRTEASVELARVEFERARLAREIAQCDARRMSAQAELSRATERMRQLHAALRLVGRGQE